MSYLYFITFRISMFFLLAYIGFFSNMKISRVKFILLFIFTFALSSLVDFSVIFYFNSGTNYIIATILNFAISLCFGIMVSEKKGWSPVFTGLCASDFILPGNIICYFVFKRTGDIFSSVIVQVFIQTVFLAFLIRFVSKYYKENEEDMAGWGSICLIPPLFYFSITFFSVWPMNIIDHPEALPGVVCIFILMAVTFTCGVIFYTRKGIKQKNDMNLVFLAEYSDRLRSESAKVNEMSSKIEEMNNATLTITSEILDLLEQKKYDDIKTIITAITTDSRILAKERLCSNNSMNSILVEAEEYAKRAGIGIDFNLNVPERLGTMEFDYAVVVERMLNYAMKYFRTLFIRKFTVSMYSSGGWLNAEMRARIREYDDISDGEQGTPENEMLKKKMHADIKNIFDVPEVNAFVKKYEVQRSIQIKMGVLGLEFNVRIN